MVIKGVGKDLCDERTGNILERITTLDGNVKDIKNNLSKFINNHAAHIQKNSKTTREQIEEINKKILFIMNELQDAKLLKAEEEKRNKRQIDWYKWLLPVIIGAVFKALDLIFG